MRRRRAARPGDGERNAAEAGWSTLLRAAIGVLTWAALCAILLGYNLFPGRLSLEVGEPSPELIRAPRSAEYVDEDETGRLRREAEARVSPQYTPMPYARADAERRVSQTFHALAAPGGGTEGAGGGTSPSLLADEAVRGLESASGQQLAALEQAGRAIVRQVMSKEIREGTADLKAAREQAERLARNRAEDPRAAAVLAEVVKREVGPTRHQDEEATEAARDEARQRVQPVVRTIEADHAIIFQGERVTREHIAMLRALGLTSPRLDYRRLASTVVIVGLILLLLAVQTRHWARDVYQRPKRLLLLALLTVVPLFVISLVTLALPKVWMLMVPAAALMAAVLLGDTVGVALALAASLLVGMMANAGLPAVLLALGSAAAGLAFAANIWPVWRLRTVVGAMAATNLVLVIAVGMLEGAPWPGIAREAGLATLLYSPGAAILALGGIVVLQRPFGITTHLALLELSNPDLPLLRQLQSEAPGTHHHSVMVANLAEAAAEEIGADALLARVGGLYHDIGKLDRPGFFVENQALLGLENAHDRLSSSLSGLIIISHVKDGVDLGRRHRLPPEIVDIIAEHHGRTLMSYFYQRALSTERPESVSEDQYRYPGPLPSTAESALVMLADSVQAAAKSLAEPTPQRVQQMVREIFRDRVVTGQLELCDLTLRQISAAESVMSRVLTASLCRNRIEYREVVAAG
jgi:putative nucleotidyltransferase with HDIG domain